MNEKSVIIRFWRPCGPKFPGHVSIETFSDEGLSDDAKINIGVKMKYGPGVHASFWPKNVCEERCQHEKNIDHLHTAQEDINVEKHPAEDNDYGCVYELKELDISAINTTFEAFQKNPKNWSLLGGSPLIKFFASNKEMQNCSGLVYLLLKVGGVDKFLSTWTWMKLGARELAPSGAKIALFAAPFAAFACYRVAKEATGTIRSIQTGVMLDHVHNVLDPFKKQFNPLRQHNPSLISDPLAATFRSSPTATQPFTVTNNYIHQVVSDFAWLLSIIDERIGHIGLSVSVIIVLVAAGYISFAGLGAVASFAVVTPSDIYNVVKEASIIQNKIALTQLDGKNDKQEQHNPRLM